MNRQTLELHRRRQRMAAAVHQVINADLPNDYDAVIARFSTAADQFIEAMERGLPALREALEKELAELHRSIKIAGASEPPSLSINSTGFKLPDDEPPAQPLPDSRFSLPTDEPRTQAPKPGPFNLPDDD
jgi:hypothetical protein